MSLMDPIDAFAAAFTYPVALLRAVTGASVASLTARGIPATYARELTDLAPIYTRGPLAQALEKNGHGLATIQVIEKLARRLPTGARHTFRLTLARMAGDVDHIHAAGRALLPATPPPKTGARITRRKNHVWSVTFTGPAATIAQLYDPFKHTRDPATALRDTITTGGVSTVLRPIVVIPLHHTTKVLDGTKDETTFKCSDGVIRTSTQIADMELDPTWGFALTHPVAGPVDLVRTQRFANTKQRILATVDNPTCAWDGCTTPADECQIHHLVAWHHGGHTTSSNLATCCNYHNGVNDDNPNAPPRYGHLTRHNGKVTRVYH